ncbi:MAG TPA: glycosyltransferase family A protein [Acidimicrobiales bacterium]|nr:glycosyltransferase family A protein [Acidimicrobiales bacterium]
MPATRHPGSGPPGAEAAVLVPTYQGAETVGRALESAIESIERSGRRVVVSIADDGSTDGTVDVVEGIAARSAVPMVVTRRPTNGGTGAARNLAAAMVDAAVLLFLDQDDEYLPDHVGTCLAALDEDHRRDFVRTRVLFDDPVHPDWTDAIERSLTQPLAVRRHLHRLVGGFVEDPAVAAVGCDDIFYNRLVRRWGTGEDLGASTVRFHRRPGNSFDRQYDRKFSRPFDEACDTLGADRRDAVAGTLAAFDRAAHLAHRRARRSGPAGLRSAMVQLRGG